MMDALDDSGSKPQAHGEPTPPKGQAAPRPGRKKDPSGLFSLSELLIESLIKICGWSAILSVIAIFVFVFAEAAPMMGKLDWYEFFTSSRWIPNPAPGNKPSYGALALIAGTFTTTLLSMVIAVPLGLGAAVYISEFATGKLKEILKNSIELLAAVPSIVWGFIGITLMSEIMRHWFGATNGTNLLNSSLILAFMAVPLIVSISEDALRAVPDAYREAAMALGANKWEIVYRVLFPTARNGLLAAVMLGVGRAIGETMAVLLASGNAGNMPTSFYSQVKTMTTTIASELGETANGSDHYRILFVLGVLLFLITCSINLISDLIIKGTKGKTHA